MDLVERLAQGHAFLEPAQTELLIGLAPLEEALSEDPDQAFFGLLGQLMAILNVGEQYLCEDVARPVPHVKYTFGGAGLDVSFCQMETYASLSLRLTAENFDPAKGFAQALVQNIGMYAHIRTTNIWNISVPEMAIRYGKNIANSLEGNDVLSYLGLEKEILCPRTFKQDQYVA